MRRLFATAKDRSVFVRNFIFGIEDSLVSTVGLLSGIASASVPRETILYTGVIYIAVEAFSMAVGSFLSEESAGDAGDSKHGAFAHAAFGAVVMFVSFAVAGLVPLAPYLFASDAQAFWISIWASIAVLLGLGFLMGILTKAKPFSRALRMAILGGAAIAIGVAVGRLL